MNYNQNWLTYADTGIKFFNRCGSRTIVESYGNGMDYKRFMELPYKVCVVRDPFDRLMSFWTGIVVGEQYDYRKWGYPEFRALDELFEYVLEHDPYTLEPHTRPYWVQLEGLWRPEDHELMTLRDFVAEPPYALPPVVGHFHHSQQREYEAPDFFKEFARRDYELFERAKKDPLERGPSTDDGP